jgi:hypothetical protein
MPAFTVHSIYIIFWKPSPLTVFRAIGYRTNIYDYRFIVVS